MILKFLLKLTMTIYIMQRPRASLASAFSLHSTLGDMFFNSHHNRIPGAAPATISMIYGGIAVYTVVDLTYQVISTPVGRVDRTLRTHP